MLSSPADATSSAISSPIDDASRCFDHTAPCRTRRLSQDVARNPVDAYTSDAKAIPGVDERQEANLDALAAKAS